MGRRLLKAKNEVFNSILKAFKHILTSSMKSWIKTFTSVILVKCKDVPRFWWIFTLFFTFFVFVYILHTDRARSTLSCYCKQTNFCSQYRARQLMQNKKSRTNDFVDLSWILSLVEEIKLDNESRLLFGVCVLIQVQLWKEKPFISNNNMEISGFNSKKSSHFLYK